MEVALLAGADGYRLPDGVVQMRGLVRGSTCEENVAGAERRIVATGVGVLARAKSRSSFKGYVLLAAISAEILAMLFLALAIRVVIVSA